MRMDTNSIQLTIERTQETINGSVTDPNLNVILVDRNKFSDNVFRFVDIISLAIY